jgi:hypothetical protein
MRNYRIWPALRPAAALKAPLPQRKLDEVPPPMSPGGAAMPKEIAFEEALARAKRMSERYVEKGPYEFFPMPEIVEDIQKGLAKNLVNHGRLFCP